MAIKPTVVIEREYDGPPPMSRAVQIAIVGTFLILLAGVLYYARGFFLPVILALLITLAFMPLVRALSRRGIPPVATAIMVVLGIGAGVAGLAILLAEPTARMFTEAPQIIEQLRERFGGVGTSGPLSRLIEARLEEVQAIAEGMDEAGRAAKVVLAQPGIIAGPPTRRPASAARWARPSCSSYSSSRQAIFSSRSSSVSCPPSATRSGRSGSCMTSRPRCRATFTITLINWLRHRWASRWP
jgi:hypothetical protein